MAKRANRAGFSLVEAAIAVALVGVTAVGALTAAANSATRRSDVAARAQAALLAEDLADEIAGVAYEDPQLGSTTLGPDAGESGANRSRFDDVDDYNGWTDAGACDRSGAAISGMTGYTRSVLVQWVLSSSPTTTSVSETGVKLVTVTVSRGGRAATTIRFVRTKDWEQMTP